MNRFLLAVGLFLASAIPALAANYVEQEQFKQWLETGKPVVIVDIQPAADFSRQHFNGSIETNAFPGKTDAEKQRLDRALPVLQASQDDVVIVCPRGGGGAKNAYGYLKQKGIAEKRLYILEKGIDGWPYRNLLIKQEGKDSK